MLFSSSFKSNSHAYTYALCILSVRSAGGNRGSKRAGSRRVKFKVTKLRFQEQSEDGIIWGEGCLDTSTGNILRTKVKAR